MSPDVRKLYELAEFDVDFCAPIVWETADANPEDESTIKKALLLVGRPDFIKIAEDYSVNLSDYFYLTDGDGLYEDPLNGIPAAWDTLSAKYGNNVAVTNDSAYFICSKRLLWTCV